MFGPLVYKHDRLQELHDATLGFVNSQQPLLEYLAPREETSLRIGTHFLYLSRMLKSYHGGVFCDVDFEPHGDVRGSPVSFVRKEEAASVVKRALEGTFKRTLSETKDMEICEQMIRGELKTIATYLNTARNLSLLQAECALVAKKLFPLKTENDPRPLTRTRVSERIYEATLVLQAEACPPRELLDQVSTFARLVHQYAAEELKGPPQEIPSTNFLLQHFMKTFEK